MIGFVAVCITAWTLSLLLESVWTRCAIKTTDLSAQGKKNEKTQGWRKSGRVDVADGLGSLYS